MGELVWDERLIGQAEAYQLAATRAWRAAIRGGIAYLDCDQCGQALLVLGAASSPFPTTTDALVGAVLRHAVQAHDMILNRKNRRPPDGGIPRASRGDDQRGQPGTAEGGPVRGGRHAARRGRLRAGRPAVEDGQRSDPRRDQPPAGSR